MTDSRPYLAQKSLISSLRDAASAINSGSNLETVLQQLVTAACRYANWTLGSVMAIDVARGYAHVIVRQDPTLIHRALLDRWDLAMSPSLLALQRNEPVYIRDARVSDAFPGYRQEAFERDYRTVLVMPMNCVDDEGRPMVLSVVAREIMEVSEDDLAFLGMIVHLGAIAVEKQHRLRKEKRAVERLHGVLEAHTSLLQQVLAGGSLPLLVGRLSELLPNPVVVADLTANLLVAGRSPDPSVYDEAAWQTAMGSILGRQLMKAARDAADNPTEDAKRLFLEDGTNRLRISAKFELLIVDGVAVGVLILFPSSTAFSDLDVLLLDSAKFAFSVLLMRSFVQFRFETRTLTELFLELVEGRWRDRDEILQRAQRLDVPLGTGEQMIVIEFPEKTRQRASGSIDLHHALTRLLQQQSIRAPIISVGGGLVCLLGGEGARDTDRVRKLMKRAAEELQRAAGEEPTIILGNPCAAISDYPWVWERCRRVVDIARAFGRSGVLTVEDFGPLPMLAAAANSAEVKGFVQGAIGDLVAHDRAHGTQYLETLSSFVREGCRSQACADAMGLHVTTLRYRLSRIQELFQVDVDTPDKRFAVELAIRLHGVIGGREVAPPSGLSDR